VHPPSEPAPASHRLCSLPWLAPGCARGSLPTGRAVRARAWPGGPACTRARGRGKQGGPRAGLRCGQLLWRITWHPAIHLGIDLLVLRRKKIQSTRALRRLSLQDSGVFPAVHTSRWSGSRYRRALWIADDLIGCLIHRRFDVICEHCQDWHPRWYVGFASCSTVRSLDASGAIYQSLLIP